MDVEQIDKDLDQYIEDNFRDWDTRFDAFYGSYEESPRTVQLALKQAGKHNPRNRMTNRRMKEAKDLLSQTDTPIWKVGLMSGFKTARFFNTQFHLHVGMTPKTYRESTKR